MKKFKSGDVPNIDFKLAVKKPIQIRCIIIDDDFEVETMEGALIGKKGDYLMVGIANEMYPCSKQIFDQTYDIVKIVDKDS